MVGKRIYPDVDGNCELLNPGEYRKWKGTSWLVCVPTGIHGTIDDRWKIEEHEDGTITVSPSIEVSSPGQPDLYWHGFLRKGIWESC